jgi:hypothetical protein
MFRRSRKDKVMDSATSLSELATKLAGDKKFRKQVRSAVEHGSAVRARTRGSRGVGDAARRFMNDQALQAELRRTRDELENAYSRLGAVQRRGRARRVMLVLGAASAAAIPQVRSRVRAVVSGAPGGAERVKDFAGRARDSAAGAMPSSGSSSPRSLEDLTKEELYARAQEAEIPGRSEMSKEQLITALRAHSG